MVRYFALALCLALSLGAQTPPDPLILTNGEKVTSSDLWRTQRRPELLGLFEDRVFGKSAPPPSEMRMSEVVVEPKALKGKAIRKQVTLYFTELNAGPRINLLIYLPAGKTPAPVFLGLNAEGNQAVAADPGIVEHQVWVKDPVNPLKIAHLPPDERSRGANAANWQVEKILDHGYGLATFYYQEAEPDSPAGAQEGIRSAMPDRTDWSAIGVWAWGLSRALDFLLTDHAIDPKHIAAIGHGRLGRAALWAAAQDERFSMAIADDTGKGGASLYTHKGGDTPQHLAATFPHWFTPGFGKEPPGVDANELLALIAPRPLYISSAEADAAADPRGEYLAASGAGSVYKLLGKHGLPATPPAPNSQQKQDVGYHVRTGKLDVSDTDWDQFLGFADSEWGTPHAMMSPAR
jgi:hypothetical protein